MIEKLVDLKNYQGEDRIVHFTDYMLSRSHERDVKNFKSGFEIFDTKIGGMETGEVVVISGKTKMGKTLFAESWLHGILLKDSSIRSMILSFEVPTEKLLLKYVMEPEREIYVPMNLKTMDFEWLLNRVMEGIIKHNARILLIDHLHFMVDMNTNQNMSLNIGAFMRRLKKDIAIDLGIAVILIAHQGQLVEGRDATVNTIRDSSFIAQESDSIITVTRKKNSSSKEEEKIRAKCGDEFMDMLLKKIDPADVDDEYSMGLSLVSIERTRRTGVFDYKKLFWKSGRFLEEI